MISVATALEDTARWAARNFQNTTRQGNIFTRYCLVNCPLLNSIRLDEDPNRDRLQRDQYLDIPNYSAANGENTDVASFPGIYLRAYI